MDKIIRSLRKYNQKMKQLCRRCEICGAALEGEKSGLEKHARDFQGARGKMWEELTRLIKEEHVCVCVGLA